MCCQPALYHRAKRKALELEWDHGSEIVLYHIFRSTHIALWSHRGLVEGDVIRIVGSKSGRSLGQLWPCMLVSRTGTDSRPSHLGGSAPKRGTAIDSQGMTKKESHVALVVVIVVVVVVVVV